MSLTAKIVIYPWQIVDDELGQILQDQRDLEFTYETVGRESITWV